MESDDNTDECERYSCDDILNCILPPREWEVNGNRFRQCVSNKPATELNVKKLGENFDTYLRQFNAKEVGICPIKQELYGQCFSKFEIPEIYLYGYIRP
jgi:dynein light intermediate chain, axonemal